MSESTGRSVTHFSLKLLCTLILIYNSSDLLHVQISPSSAKFSPASVLSALLTLSWRMRRCQVTPFFMNIPAAPATILFGIDSPVKDQESLASNHPAYTLLLFMLVPSLMLIFTHSLNPSLSF